MAGKYLAGGEWAEEEISTMVLARREVGGERQNSRMEFQSGIGTKNRGRWKFNGGETFCKSHAINILQSLAGREGKIKNSDV